MKTKLFILTLIASLFAMSVSLQAKPKTKPIVKVYLKNRNVVEGELLKHWFGAKQSFATSNHKFTIQTADEKVKYEAVDVDSVVIKTEGDNLKPGEVYICYGSPWPTLWDKDKKIYKLYERTLYSPRLSLLKCQNMDNYGKNYSQMMIYFYLFIDNKEKVFFANAPAGFGPHSKGKIRIKDLISQLKDDYPELSAAVKEQYDKEKFNNKTIDAFKEELEGIFNFCKDWLDNH